MNTHELDGLAALRDRCPAGTTLVGPVDDAGVVAAVNGVVEAACMRPDGTRHGSSIAWYAHGTKASEGDYADGLKEGNWSFWHANGRLSGQGQFRGGKAHGTWVTWDENGRKESETTYADGVQQGTPRRWDREGRPQ